MAKGYINSGDPERQTVFDTIPDRLYTVDGIDRFIVKEGSEPSFVPQRNDLVVQFEFRTPTGEKGPAASCTAAEFWMLVKALGGDVNVATSKQRMSSDALIRAQTSVNANKTSITVQSTAGWANGLRKQLIPPEGKYKVVLAKAHRPDFAENDLTFQLGKNSFTGKDQEQLVLEFEIVGNSLGKPTLYDGYRIWQYMENPFVPEVTTLDGTRIVAKERGCPVFGHTENGGEVPSAYGWKVFWKYFAPAALEHDWQTDELDQPQILIIKDALEEQIPVTIVWRKKEKSKKGNYGFTWKDIALENELPETQIEEETVQPVQLNDLISYIEQKWNKDIFEQSTSEAVIFSEAGRNWAKEYLAPAWQKAGLNLEERKPLHQLSGAEVDHLLQAFKQIHGEVGVSSGW